ncbi:MAG: chromosome segregation and condensation protein ScpB [Edaphobacter sp.]|nr:chromosome segregation and condensation protein ScpB [Edaphobacter sp.]
MSLKAKIEAVIYASEEPVTLAQLTGLLGHEAQAELDHLDAAQQSLTLDEAPSDPDVLNDEVLSEGDRAEALDHALHEAAAREAAHAKAIHQHEVADAAAMRTSDTLDPEALKPEAIEAAQISESPAEEIGEKKAARESKEDKEKARRLREYFRTILDQLIADYATGDRGLEIREVASGFRLSTKPEYHDAVRGFVKSLKPPLKLSLQALETLAVVAYKQPVTAPEISEIRGVDSGGVLGSLMARKLVTTAGRKQVIGRPILYKTTKDFLLRFGLKDINELPSIEEFEKMAGELADQEPVQEEIPMEHDAPETSKELEREIGSVEPQADGSGESSEENLEPDNLEQDSRENPAEEIIVDGRISGLPPNYDTDQLPADDTDSSALDAEVQSDLHKESNEGE